MAKVQIGFRFRPEVAERLGELAGAAGVTRTVWLERAVMGAEPEPELRHEDLHEDLPVAVQAEALRPKGRVSPKIGRVDPDKIAAFQRKMARKK